MSTETNRTAILNVVRDLRGALHRCEAMQHKLIANSPDVKNYLDLVRLEEDIRGVLARQAGTDENASHTGEV